MKGVTTIEQSIYLAGILDPKTADMYYLHQDDEECGTTVWPIDDGYQPCEDEIIAWSFDAMVDVISLPGMNTSVTFRKDDYLGWFCYWNLYPADYGLRIGICKAGATKIDALMELIVHLAQHGYIKKK